MPIVNLANLPQFAAVNLLADAGESREKLVIPNGIQVILDWTLADGKVGHNVLYGSAGSGFTPTPAECDTVLTGLTGGNWTPFAGHLAATTALASVSMRDVRSVDQPLVTSIGAAHPGTAAGLSLPNETALVVTLHTAKAGRSGRGRMYMMGYDVSEVVAGNLVAATCVTDTTNWAASNIVTAFGNVGLGWSLGLKHRIAYTSPLGTVHDDRPATLLPILGAVVRDNHWDSQRRRGLK